MIDGPQQVNLNRRMESYPGICDSPVAPDTAQVSHGAPAQPVASLSLVSLVSSLEIERGEHLSFASDGQVPGLPSIPILKDGQMRVWRPAYPDPTTT